MTFLRCRESSAKAVEEQFLFEALGHFLAKPSPVSHTAKSEHIKLCSPESSGLHWGRNVLIYFDQIPPWQMFLILTWWFHPQVQSRHHVSAGTAGYCWHQDGIGAERSMCRNLCVTYHHRIIPVPIEIGNLVMWSVLWRQRGNAIKRLKITKVRFIYFRYRAEFMLVMIFA